MINPNNLCPGCMNEKVTDGKCPICGYNPDEPLNPSLLKPGSLLDSRYVVGKVLESNGEGVTYLGFDTVTAVAVNIREFFPTGLCERDSDGTSVVMLSGKEFNYNDSLAKFIELSRKLFRLNELPALFDVLDVRESNNTAYRITRAVPGISLREFLMRNGGILKWDQARSLFAPLVASISALHSAGIIHRGISPDTLIVGKDGKLRLNGFCIEEIRTAKSELTSQLFPGFAAVEQYGLAGTHGPWTDIYAFAATIYRTLVGNPPPEAPERLQNDNMTIPAKIARETPKPVLEVLANALQVLPNDRTQNIDEMRHGLSVSSVQSVSAVASNSNHQSELHTNNNGKIPNNKGKKTKANKSNKMYGIVAGVATAFFLGFLVILIMWSMGIFSKGNKSDVSSTHSNNWADSSEFSSSTASKIESAVSTVTGKRELESFKNKYLSQLTENSDYKDVYKFKVVSKEYSEDYARGEVIRQSPEAGKIVDEGTTIELVLSLGASHVNMVNVIGEEENNAIFELVKLGFDYQNIIIKDVYVSDVPTGCVAKTDPEKGMRISIDSTITLYVNRQTATSESSD